LLLGAACALLPWADARAEAPGDSNTIQEELEAQRRQLAALEEALGEQARLIAEQKALLESQQAQIQDLLTQKTAGDDALVKIVGMGAGQRGLQATEDPDAAGEEGSLPEAPKSKADPSEPPSERVGEGPEEPDAPPEIPVIADLGGVLTPRGVFVLEPGINFSTNQLNRFVFSGTGLATALLIGQISAADADRDTFVSSLGARYGVTSRFEVDLKLPFVRRNDRQTNLIPSEDDDIRIERDLDGSGLGDIELGLHYQLNRGTNGWPFFIGNLRVKSDTGEGPFDISRDARGLESELPTGSGFWSIQPSLTAIFPADPAVFYANISYLFNLSEDVDQIVNTGAGPALFSEIDPGDSIGASFGVGIGLNQRSSFNLGYEHQFIQKTKSTINDIDFEGETLQVGSFQFGLSYSMSERTGLNLALSIGATEDAPDMQVSLRVPVAFEWF
jgi:hypothetical protein